MECGNPVNVPTGVSQKSQVEMPEPLSSYPRLPEQPRRKLSTIQLGPMRKVSIQLVPMDCGTPVVSQMSLPQAPVVVPTEPGYAMLSPHRLLRTLMG